MCGGPTSWYVVDCDASDYPLAGIVARAPTADLLGLGIRRALTDREHRWSIALREMAGYILATRALARRGLLRGLLLLEHFGDSKCAEAISRKGGWQAAYDPETDELLPLEYPLGIFGDA